LSASALGFHVTQEATEQLTGILLDASDAADVRGHAAEALAHTFQMKVTPPGVRAALRASALDPDDTVRYEAVWALGTVGRVRDIPLLERVLAEENARPSPNQKIVDETIESLRCLAQRRRTPRQKTGVSR